MLEEFIREWALRLALLIDAVAVLAVVAASFEVTFRVVQAIIRSRLAADLQRIRWRLGNWLGLALELLIGSDVIRTAVAPSWPQIGKLGAIVALRIIINYTLMHDIKEDAPSGSA